MNDNNNINSKSGVVKTLLAVALALVVTFIIYITIKTI